MAQIPRLVSATGTDLAGKTKDVRVLQADKALDADWAQSDATWLAR
jgi:hypothetical protein